MRQKSFDLDQILKTVQNSLDDTRASTTLSRMLDLLSKSPFCQHDTFDDYKQWEPYVTMKGEANNKVSVKLN